MGLRVWEAVSSVSRGLRIRMFAVMLIRATTMTRMAISLNPKP